MSNPNPRVTVSRKCSPCPDQKSHGPVLIQSAIHHRLVPVLLTDYMNQTLLLLLDFLDSIKTKSAYICNITATRKEKEKIAASAASQQPNCLGLFKLVPGSKQLHYIQYFMPHSKFYTSNYLNTH